MTQSPNGPMTQLLAFHSRWHRSFSWTPVRSKNLFPQPQRFRRDLNEFVVLDELNCLFQAEGLVRNQPDGFIGGLSAHIVEVFFSPPVYIHHNPPRRFSRHHSFLTRFPRP